MRARLVHLYRDGEQVAVLPAGRRPDPRARRRGRRPLVADTTGDALLRYDVGGTGAPRAAGSTAVAGRPYGMAYDAPRGLVYVTATARNLLLQYRVTPGGLQQLRAFPTVRDAYDVAVVPATGRVVVAGESGSLLQLLDP